MNSIIFLSRLFPSLAHSKKSSTIKRKRKASLPAWIAIHRSWKIIISRKKSRQISSINLFLIVIKNKNAINREIKLIETEEEVH